MATITKRGDHQFQALVRRRGHPAQTKTFETKRDAQAWSAEVESKIRRGVFDDLREIERMTLGEALEKYKCLVTPKKKGAEQERYRIEKWKRHGLAYRPLATLRTVDFVEYVTQRQDDEVSGSTIRLELAIIRNLHNVAKVKWSLPLGSNWIARGVLPKPGKARARRLVGDEEERLLAAAEDGYNGRTLKLAIQLAIHTGMRAGELRTMTWQNINLMAHYITLNSGTTKNNEGRVVPLFKVAANLLRAYPHPISGGVVLDISENSLSHLFRGACDRAGIVDLHFHDLRHEAASRFARHMPAQTLAKIMGWKSIQMAMRYFNLRPEEAVDILHEIEDKILKVA